MTTLAFDDPCHTLKPPVHVRKQQRNGRKSVTTVQGLATSLDLKEITKALRKELCCNGCVVASDDFGDVVQLQGDHRAAVKCFLLKHALVDHVYVHGD